ncbi:uncharacterized protein LOC135704250 [Ochlerotatus camptorhynchus]|uniref:uncharacterized protein LOC135704250 n=1 Tax=Ochlerotatus camptorhynchus TaxID=644619 RepID=UPI0031D1A19E
MDKLLIFKVCDAARTTRLVIAAFPTLDSLLEQGSIALQNDVVSVYTEVEGCRITSDLALSVLHSNLLMLLGMNESWNPQQMQIISSPEQVAGDTSLNSIPYSNDERQTYDQKVAPTTISFVSNTPEQSVPTSVIAAPDFIAMDLLNNIEEDERSISEQNTIINTLISITSPGSEIVDFERQSVMTNEKQTTELSNMQRESYVATSTIAEGTDVPQAEISEAVDEQSESEANSDHENQSPNKSRKRKHDSSGVKLQRNTKKHAATELKFRSFVINWDKISDILLIKLQNLQQFKNTNTGKPVPQSLRFSKQDLSSFLNEVVNQLRLIDTDIRAETMANEQLSQPI